MPNSWCREVNLNPEDRVSLEISHLQPIWLISVEGKDLNGHICEKTQEHWDIREVLNTRLTQDHIQPDKQQHA